MSKLTPPYNLTIEEKVAIINNLVLNRNDTWDRTPIEPDGAALFTAQELMEAADKTPIKKATGSGGIFPETVMLTSKVVPLRNLDVLNRLLSQEFTLVWKKAMNKRVTRKNWQVDGAQVANIGGPSGTRRRILCGVVQSIVLHGTPICVTTGVPEEEFCAA
ncbi:hypothetical protein QE152_g178 [Popillia japonica]|uniref:Uncharacterized protein n=1 Tax=Popillia japonica TaxID=7064 RepID=A0AAW1NL71_POPJA